MGVELVRSEFTIISTLEGTKKVRRCPICGVYLKLEDYHYYQKYWYDHRLSIPCYACYDLMMILKRCYKYWVEEYAIHDYKVHYQFINGAFNDYVHIVNGHRMDWFIELGMIDMNGGVNQE